MPLRGLDLVPLSSFLSPLLLCGHQRSISPSVCFFPAAVSHRHREPKLLLPQRQRYSAKQQPPSSQYTTSPSLACAAFASIRAVFHQFSLVISPVNSPPRDPTSTPPGGQTIVRPRHLNSQGCCYSSSSRIVGLTARRAADGAVPSWRGIKKFAILFFAPSAETIEIISLAACDGVHLTDHFAAGTSRLQ